MAAKRANKTGRDSKDACSFRFEATQLDAVFGVLDAIAWLSSPNLGQISQFAGVDPRTAGKLLKNCQAIGLVDTDDGSLSLSLPYPYRGTDDEKRAVVREALVRMPLLASTRQFMTLGDDLATAVRKAATVVGITAFEAEAVTPLLKWAEQLDALKPRLIAEDLAADAAAQKRHTHEAKPEKRTVFLSHSSKDKPIIRQLAADLTAEGITVWLDEQRIRVGDSIPDGIAQGLAGSDFFLVALSKDSVASNWVRRELSNALMAEVSRREIKVLPVKLDDCEVPDILRDRKYANFSTSYREGLRDVITAVKGTHDE